MDLRRLEFFCAVVEQRGFTRAAESCHVSQSAVSQQIRALEADLDCELLHREGRSFTVTPAGEALHHGARDLLRRAGDLRRHVSDVAMGSVRSLSFGYLPRYGGWEVPGVLAAFAAKHPATDVSAVSGSHDELYNALQSGSIDLAFNDRRRALSPEFENLPLMTCSVYAEISTLNPLAHRQQLTMSDLAHEVLVVIAPEDQRSVERAYYQDVLAFHGEVLYARSPDEAHMMVAANRGVLLIELREEGASTGPVVCRVPVMAADGIMHSDYYAFWRKDRSNTLIKEFAQLLRDAFA